MGTLARSFATNCPKLPGKISKKNAQNSLNCDTNQKMTKISYCFKALGSSVGDIMPVYIEETFTNGFGAAKIDRLNWSGNFPDGNSIRCVEDALERRMAWY